MKESTVLDFAELRLLPPSCSLCELHISAEGETERIACVLSKTLLSQMQAARKLHTAGAGSTLRLEGPRVYNGSIKPWFTKGTLERFTLCISTPELLERVKAIEDELIQLEQVRNLQAGSLPQVHNYFSRSADMTASAAGVSTSDSRSGHCHYSEIDSSKKDLLKAMDVRLTALQQEQNKAFSCAVAAGFHEETIKDLLAFADFFGADQLRVACNWYYELLLKWQRGKDNEATEHMSQEIKSHKSHGPEAMKLGLPRETFHVDDALNTKALGICQEPINAHSPSCPDELEDVSPVRRRTLTTKGLPQRMSPRRRSASPLKKVQLGRFGSRRAGSVAIRSINYFTEHQSKERNQDMDTSSSESEGNGKSCILDDVGPAKKSTSATARRLSVQAAINLFESKQSKEFMDVPGKQRSSKPPSRRGSLDRPNSRVLGQFDLNGKPIPASNTDGRYGPETEQMMPSPNKFANCLGNEFICDNTSLLQGAGTHDGKRNSSPKEVLFLGRGSSTSEDCFFSELDSIGDNRTPEPSESDLSNARSTITSISHGEAYTAKSDGSSETRLCQSTPTNHNSSVSMYESQYSQGSESFKQFQPTSSLEKEPRICKGNEVGSEDRVMSSDFTTKALASLADHQSLCHKISGSNEGRFYEHYRKLRDAKMMEEQKSRRAEREAKLRLMEETLELRKAEMDARTAKLNKNGSHAETRAAKLLALKANLREVQRVEEDRDKDHSQGQALSRKDSMRSDSSHPSPPLTPRLVKEHALSPKLHKPRKAVVTYQKASTPRSSTRASSVSPKTTPQGSVRKVSSQQNTQLMAQMMDSNVSENSLICPVSCFSDLKKEISKPVRGKHSDCVHMYSKYGGLVVHPPGSSRVSPLDSNGTVPLQTNSSSRTIKVEKKNKARLTRPSAMTNEFKDAGPGTEEEISGAVNTQTDTKIDGIFVNKIRRNAVAPVQEVRPFLRKGSGIGPGAGPGVMKLKSEAAKSSDEDVSVTPLKTSDEEAVVMTNKIEESVEESIFVEETVQNFSTQSFPCVIDDEKVVAQAILSDGITQHSEGDFFRACDDAKQEHSRDDELSDNERACHTISFPIDLASHDFNAINCASKQNLTDRQMCHEGVVKRQETSATLSQLFFGNTSHTLQKEPSNGSASFRANLAIEENNASRFSPLKATTLASSSLKSLGAAIPDFFSPSSAATVVDSPVGSPASWNASRVQYASETETARTQKSFAPQKPVVVIVPPKEPARGFKRLLKFGRKNRAAPGIIVMDVVSGSTPSEGDDETEDFSKGLNNYSAHDVMRKAYLRERLMTDYGIASPSSGNGIVSNKGSVQSSQSAIPVAPTNFRLKYDHALGTSTLKAPRSFFSLSTFRSKGGEGRSK